MPRTRVHPVSEMNRNNVESFCFVQALFFCVVFSFFLLFIIESGGSREFFFDNNINVNSAGEGSLVRLSSIGRVKAEAIVRYRQVSGGQGMGDLVFERAEDLEKVKGIGRGTVENIRPWLKFK